MNAAVGLFSLTGRRALVTGAKGGIGLAIARGLASAGARVFLGARSHASIAPVLAGLAGEGGDVAPWIADVRDMASCAVAMADIDAEGGADILVNCAGVIARGAFDAEQLDAWDDVVAVNLTAPYRLAALVAPAMRGRRWGRIVNVGSVLSVEGKAMAIGYVATKHGVAGLTRALAAELGPANICVNALCPGYVRTEITRSLQVDAAYSAQIVAATPLGRWAEPDDMVGPALFLCSEASRHVTGQLLVADGGMTATH